MRGSSSSACSLMLGPPQLLCKGCAEWISSTHCASRLGGLTDVAELKHGKSVHGRKVSTILRHEMPTAMNLTHHLIPALGKARESRLKLLRHWNFVLFCFFVIQEKNICHHTVHSHWTMFLFNVTVSWVMGDRSHYGLRRPKSLLTLFDSSLPKVE